MYLYVATPSGNHTEKVGAVRRRLDSTARTTHAIGLLGVNRDPSVRPWLHVK